MRLQHEHVIVESSIPISHILTLNMDHRLNAHGVLQMDVVITPEMHQTFLRRNYLGENMTFLAELSVGEQLIFNGKINRVAYEQRGDVLTASIGVSSYSVELDEHQMRRSFQKTDMTFHALLTLVMSQTKADFHWQVGEDQVLEKPFVQYDETNWAFIKRLASAFNRPIHANVLVDRGDLYFGVRSGVRQNIDEATILEEGIRDDYYKNGGYNNQVPRDQYYYVKVRNRSPWQLGDTGSHRNRNLTVIQTEALFEKGELTFIHTLGAGGYLYQSQIYGDQLVGLNLEGTIRNTEKESITIQLDIDETDQAHYHWSWRPEIGNFGYVMPEVGSRVVLTFPTKNEADAFGSRLLRTNADSGVYHQVQNRQFVTAEDKTIGLFPEQILLAGRNQAVRMTLNDQSGIHLDSRSNIRIRAREEIYLRGKKVTVVASDQALVQSAQANIDMATTFNFFAPKGVNTVSHLPYQPPRKHQDATSDHQNVPLSDDVLGASLDASANQKTVIGSLPTIALGQTAIAIDQARNGKHISSNQRSFSSMGNFSMKGGSRVPKKEIEDAD